MHQYETDHLNTPITINKVEFVIEKLLQKKFLVPDGFTGEFTKCLKKN